jgi:protein bicaudal D
MADISITSMEPDQLRLEVDRLQRELDQTSSEKMQSAQFGLVLLEEKENLEVRCEELETLYDTTKNELEVTQEALAKFQSNQQVGILHYLYNEIFYAMRIRVTNMG